MVSDHYLERKTFLRRKYPNVLFHGDCVIKGGVEIGSGTHIGEYAYLGKWSKIGRECKILYHVTICKNMVIGDRVFIGPNTSFLNDKLYPIHSDKAPVISHDVKVGGGCCILPGVHIREHSIIGAGSVVTRDIPCGVVAYGNPCKVIKKKCDNHSERVKEMYKHTHA